MRLYRVGDQGEPVRDIQDRLSLLGFGCGPDTPGEYGKATASAVATFQRSRGLSADGIVGPDTWRVLYEAGYALGDRLLYLRRPMLRGEDVAELQRRLNSLGFEAGKVDGIFGKETERALHEFQHNRSMAEDGIAGHQVLSELQLVARATEKTGREAIREREWLRALPPTLAGSRIYLDAACRTEEERCLAWDAANGAALVLQARGGTPLLSRSADVGRPERVRARRANRLGAHMIVSFQLPGDETPAVFFFASALSRSEAGAILATEVAARLGLGIEGRASPILKETRAPAVVVSADPLDEALGLAVVESLTVFLDRAAPPETVGG